MSRINHTIESTKNIERFAIFLSQPKSKLRPIEVMTPKRKSSAPKSKGLK